MRKFVTLLFVITFAAQFFSQSNFNRDIYRQFLDTHKDMSSAGLLNLYDAGKFRAKLDINTADIFYFDSVSSKYQLTPYEISLLCKNGFMVSERLSKNSFGEAFLDIWHNDLPVFISTDAVLHAFHVSYDRILKETETGYLIDEVKNLLTTLHSKMNELDARYSSNPAMKQMLFDVDVYLTVAAKLLDENAQPFYTETLTRVNELYNKALKGEGISDEKIFSDKPVTIDWSQFKPRGHYVDQLQPVLEQYFRAMMWLGRIEIYLLAPVSDQPEDFKQGFIDLQRQAVTSLLVTELFDLSASWQSYNNIESILEYFVGKPDNVTLNNLVYLKNATKITGASQLLDSMEVVLFQDSLKQQSFAYQLILSQILFGGFAASDSIVPASAFMLFGQRFVIDSYVTGSVVYDRIKFKGGNVCRLYPSSLDPVFALGNDAAAQLLIPDLDEYHYSSNLAALRYLIDSYDPDFWDATIYNSWLCAIRKLNPPAQRDNLPLFMQTAAFWQEKLNTQLASWAQLRHDNLLYAKQSYTGGVICSYPHCYVEPVPDFYKTLKNYGLTAAAKFGALPINEWKKTDIINYLNNLVSIMDTLALTSEKILAGEEFTQKEKNFLSSVLYDQNGQVCGEPKYKGWYAQLFYNDNMYTPLGLLNKDHVVADIHTTPTDCMGNLIGAITHVGTGDVNLGIFIADLPGAGKTAFTGPVLSFLEYRTLNFQRLTDQEWENQYLQSALRPSWVNIYLAGKTGETKGSGPSLATSVKKDDNIIPGDYLIAANYPNPFNPATIITYNIPVELSNSHVTLTIFNIQGEEIATLVDINQPAGSYVTRWEGKTNGGTEVSSGVYFYRLKAGAKQVTGKMMLLR